MSLIDRIRKRVLYRVVQREFMVNNGGDPPDPPDPDPVNPRVSFSTAGTTIAEQEVTLEIPLEVGTGDQPLAAQVPIVVSGTATRGTDFELTDGAGMVLTGDTLVIPAGSSSATLYVRVYDDSVLESSESIVLELALSNSFGVLQNALLGQITTHTVTLTDDEEATVAQFGSASGSVDEGSQAQQTYGWQVTLDQGAYGNERLRVTLDPSSTAVEGQDFELVPFGASNAFAFGSPFTFNEGSTGRTLRLRTFPNQTVDGDRTVVLNLEVVDGDVVLGAQTQHTVTIVDDDIVAPGDPIVRVQTPSGSRLEPGSGQVDYPVTLSIESGANASGLDVAFDLGGTAVRGTDYDLILPDGGTAGASDTWRFEAAEEQATGALRVYSDASTDPGETVSLTLSEPAGGAGYTVSTSSSSVTLTIEEGTAETSLEWEALDGFGAGDDVPIQSCTGIPPTPPSDVPAFSVDGVLCDVFPHVFDADGQCIGVQIVTTAANSGTALVSSADPTAVAPPATAWTNLDLDGVEIRSTYANNGGGTGFYHRCNPFRAASVEDVLRAGDYIREERIFERLKNLAGTDVGGAPGFNAWVTRHSAADVVEITLAAMNNLWEPRAGSIMSPDQDACTDYYFEHMELRGLPSGWTLLPADGVDGPGMNTARQEGGEQRPYFVAPEDDPANAGEFANHWLPAGQMILRSYVLYNTGTTTEAQALAIAGFGGYARAMSGQFAVEAFDWWGAQANPIPGPDSRRLIPTASGSGFSAEQDAEQEAYDELLATWQTGQAGSGSVSLEDYPKAAEGWYYTHGKADSAGPSGRGIYLRNTAAVCAAGFRFNRLKFYGKAQKWPHLLFRPDNGEHLTATAIATAYLSDPNHPEAPNQQTLMLPYDFQWRLDPSGCRTLYRGFIREGTLNGGSGNEYARMYTDHDWSNADTGRTVIEPDWIRCSNWAQYASIDPPKPPEGDHDSRFFHTTQSLSFGANWGPAKYFTVAHGLVLTRTSPPFTIARLERFTPTPVNSFLARSMHYGFIADFHDEHGVTEPGCIRFNPDYDPTSGPKAISHVNRGHGMMWNMLGEAFRLTFPQVGDEVRDEMLGFVEEAYRGLLSIMNQWGGTARYSKTDPVAVLNHPWQQEFRGPSEWPTANRGAIPLLPMSQNVTLGSCGTIMMNSSGDPVDSTGSQTFQLSYACWGILGATVAMLGVTHPLIDQYAVDRILVDLHLLQYRNAVAAGLDAPAIWQVVSIGPDGYDDECFEDPPAWELLNVLSHCTTAPGATWDFDREMMAYASMIWLLHKRGDTARRDEAVGYLRPYFGLSSTATLDDMIGAAYSKMNSGTAVQNVWEHTTRLHDLIGVLKRLQTA